MTEKQDEHTYEELGAAETELIRRSQEGDDSAFGELVGLHQARLRGFASRHVSNSSDVFEIVQDAFLNAYRHLDRFEAGRPFYPWVRVICHNLVLNYFRSRRKVRSINLQLVDDALLERIGAEQAPSDDDYGLNRIEALKKCLDSLAESQRELIRKRYHTGVPVKDIADRRKASPTSISMRLMRIRKRLRKCMDESLAAQT